MAITRDSTQDLVQIGKRVRILTGIESTEIDDTDLSELITMASEWFETAMGRPGKACGNHGKQPWEGVGRRGQAWEGAWEGLPMGRPSHGRSAFRDTASLPGEGGGEGVY